MSDEVDYATIQKAQVSLPPPGGLSRWALIGDSRTYNDVISYEKRQQYGIYYEMYRQHPVIRAAIDKKATFAAAGGLTFTIADIMHRGSEVDHDRYHALQAFFRASSYKKLLRLTYKDLDIYGESFWLVLRNLNGRPIKAVRLNPRYMNPRLSGGMLVGWRYGPVSSADNAIDYPEDIIIHFSLEDPENDVQGISPLHSLQRTVAQDIYAMEYNGSFFENSAQTGIIFIQKTSDANEVERNRAWLEQNYVGARKAHKPLLIEGDVDVQKSVSNRAEMEFIEGRKFLRQEMAMTLEVDLDKLGIHEDSNRSVSKEVEQAFHSEAIWPRQSVVEEELNNHLILRIFGWDDLLVVHGEGDPRRKMDQAETQEKYLKMGVFTVNQILDELGRTKISKEEGGDVRFIMGPSGMIPLHLIEVFAQMQIEKGSGDPISGLGTTTTGSRNQPTGSLKAPLTRDQREAVSQNE